MKIFKLIAGSVFLRQNAILFFGAVAVGFLNYLFYPVIGRLLDPVSFGEVQAIFSLFIQLTIFLTVLSVVAVFVVANYKDAKQRNATVLELEKAATWVALALLAITLIFNQWLQVFFNFESTMPFILLAVLLVVSVPLTFRTAFLRGRQSFVASVVSNLLSASGRFAFSIPLVFLGFGPSGALVGVVLGQLAALAYSAHRAGKVGLTRPKGLSIWSRPKLDKIWPEIKYSLFVLVGSLAITLQLTVDALAVKHLFDSHTAGLYAGIVTVARTIFFFTAPIVMALLPAVKLDAAPSENYARLRKSLVLFMAVSLPLLGAMVVFPNQVTTLLMGHQYAEVAGLLPLLAITTFVTSLLNVVVSYFLALKRYISGMLVIIGFAVTFGLIFFRHGSLQAVVECLFVGSIVSICLIAIWLARERLTSRGSIDETTSTIHRGSSAQRSRKHTDSLPGTD
jgi:O-antigen/teichoic acid export membrane protein